MKLIKILIILQFILLSSCGYKAVNNKYNYMFQVIDYELFGNSAINKKIEKNFLKFDKDINASRFFFIKVNSVLTKNVTSKDSSGNESSYEIRIIVDLDIMENKVLLDKTKIQKQVNYNTLESKFELKQYENLLIGDLTDQINLEINNYLATIK